MNSKQVTKYLSLHGEGLLSSNEVADGILYDLLSKPELDMASLSSVESLPVEVQEALLNLLRENSGSRLPVEAFAVFVRPLPGLS